MDEADYGSEREMAMLQAALEEHQYQLNHAVNASRWASVGTAPKNLTMEEHSVTRRAGQTGMTVSGLRGVTASIGEGEMLTLVEN